MKRFFRQYGRLTLALAAVLAFCAVLPLLFQQSRSIETGSWGLSFRTEGQPPAGNASKDALRRYDAVYLGDESQKKIYLTFDAGYENGCTEPILEALAKHNVKAAFFVVGNYIEQNPDLVCRMLREGHIVGNHTLHHPDMSGIADKSAFAAELNGLEEKYTALTGQPMQKFYRPPQGKFSEENLRQAQRAVLACAGQGAQLVLLPEMFCCLYQLERLRACAQPRGGEIWKHLRALACQAGVYLLGGSMPELDAQGRIYNTSFFFSPAGEELACYRKCHLFDVSLPGGLCIQESSVFTPGEQLRVVESPFGKIGLAICFDLRFPEQFRALADRGAQLVLVPAAFNSTTGPAHWEINCRSRALDNQVFLCTCAPAAAPDGPYPYYGHSMAVDPWGRILTELTGEACERIVTLNLDETARIRAQLPLLKSRRPELYRQ